MAQQWQYSHYRSTIKVSNLYLGIQPRELNFLYRERILHSWQ